MIAPMSNLFAYARHPWSEERKLRPPAKVADQLPTKGAAARFNSALAVRITNVVGTMWCAYAFALIALVGLPAVLGLTFVPGRFSTIVLWVSSEFLQLVLLSVIIVGQNIQASAADARSEATYKDADAVLSEALQIQKHLEAQDTAIEQILERLGKLPTAS
jgi:hypothetical protein